MASPRSEASGFARSALASGALATATLLVLAGCASKDTLAEKRTELQLAQLVRWLPGSYDNKAQNAADLRAGHTPHAAVVLDIVPVDSLMLGDHVFYEQRSDDASGHIKEQRLISVSVVNGHIVQSVWSLKEPRRWITGGKNPEMFTSLQPPDLKQIIGCEITWQVDEGKFSGKSDQQKCHVPAAEGGVPVAVATHIILDHDGLDWSERGFDEDGKLIYGAEDDPVRFRRRAAQ